MLRIHNDTGITSRTTGRVDTYCIIQTATNKSEGIIVAQVLLRCKGDLAEIFKAVDRIRGDAQIAQTFLIERRIQGDSDTLFEFLYLQRFELLSWHGL